MTTYKMKNYFWSTLAFIVLTILIIGTSCNGQAKKDLPKEKVSESKIIYAKQQKFIKTQSLNKGDNVHCSLQDKSGNLWFGTTGDGVYRYDGHLFTQFTVTSGLNSNSVWCILEDKSGKIWLGTNDGICLYDDHKFTKILIVLPSDTLSNKYDVWSIMQDKSGKLWFATGIGVYVYDPVGTGTSGTSLPDGALAPASRSGTEGRQAGFTPFIVTEVVNNCSFKTEYILEDKAGNYWFGGRCNPGVFRFDGKSITNLRPSGDNWAWPVLQDKNGNIWFSNWTGVYRYDGKSFTSFTKNDGLAGNVVTRIIEDKKGNLWFGGEGGISRYNARLNDGVGQARLPDGQGKSFLRFTTKDALINNNIWTILEDNTGSLWVGTNETGLYRYDARLNDGVGQARLPDGQGTKLIKFSE